MKYLIPGVLLLSIYLSCKPREQAVQTSLISVNGTSDSLETALSTLYGQESIVGFSVAIVDNNGTKFTEGFGYADLEERLDYTERTTQKIASISKTLIGISLLKAQELGKLELDDPINMYLPFEVVNSNYPNEAITIRDLATHTSSINDVDAFFLHSYIIDSESSSQNVVPYDYFVESKERLPLPSFTKNLLSLEGERYSADVFTNYKPGEKFQYSNIASTLCALVIQNAVNDPYEVFARKHILEPLQMTKSRWSINGDTLESDSRHFIDNKRVTTNYSTNSYPENGFMTSSADLAKFLSELINGYAGSGSILTKDSYKQLFKKQLTQSQMDGEREGTMGIFFEHTTNFMGDSTISIGHNGSDPGILTAMYFNPRTLIGKIVLTNTDLDFDEAVMPEFQEIWATLGRYENAELN